MQKEGYVNVWKDKLKQPGAKLGLGLGFVFEYHNKPKHTWLLVKIELQKMKVSLIDRPA